jgi:hypothetical protein
MQFAGVERDVAARVESIVTEHDLHRGQYLLIFEDVPVVCCTDAIQRRLGPLPVAVRSHNVASLAFAGIRDRTWWTRWAWSHEISKIRRFESRVCQMADATWAISDQDAQSYRQSLSVDVDGVLGVALDTDRYGEVRGGDPHTIVSIGSMDLRKGAGWKSFLCHSWSRIRRRVPDAKLILAGRHTEQFHQPAAGIEGWGMIQDDRQLLRTGQIFLNPQYSGSGVKLKSIVALLAGRTLVTTSIGAEGVAGTNGKHFLAASDERRLADGVEQLLLDHPRCRRMADEGRRLANVTYTRERLMEHAVPLVRSAAQRAAEYRSPAAPRDQRAA